MTFTIIYRTKPGDNATKSGNGEADSLDEARTLAMNAIKAKYPDGVLLDVFDASEVVELVDLDRVYAAYYRLSPRSSEAGIGRVVADVLADAKRLANEAVANAFPTGRLMTIGPAWKSPYPVKNARGVECSPSLVY